MSDTMPRRTPISRFLLVGAMFALSVLSCGREPTGLSPEGLRYSGPIAFNTQFPAGYLDYIQAKRSTGSSGPSGNLLANQTAGNVVEFDRVRIVLRNPDGSIAKDTIITFPVGASEVPVTLTIPIPASAPASGQPLTGTFAYMNGSSVVLETQTPFALTVLPTTPGTTNPPAPVVINVPVVYVGPGASATTVQILPSGLTVNTGTPFAFTAITRDASGNTVPGAPVIFESLNLAVATIDAAAGTGVAGATRGSTTIRARLIGGASSSATLTVVAPPAALVAISGGAQTANVNAQLAAPVVVQVNATDGQPAQGVTVTFAAQNGGTVGAATVTTGADGRAQTTWRLGPAAGSQTLTATAPGLTGSPVTFTATALALQPVRLTVATQPAASIAAGNPFGLTVNVVDANGAITQSFTGAVSIALTGAPAGVTLQGTTSLNASAGIATFSDLRISVPGTYSITVTSGLLVGATTNSFQVVAGAANRLSFQNYPTGGAAAGAVLDAITVQVRDALNNDVTTFTGSVTLGIASGPSGASITGTTTVNAVAGVATFNGLSLRTAGSYTLTATSAGMTSATGPGFAVAAGPATNIEIVGGGGQSAAGGATLPNPIVIKAADAFGNGIPGKTITFSPVSGSVSTSSAVTDGAGLAQTMWTIGSTAGTYTLNVASAGLTPNPLAVTATATTTTGPGPATQIAFTTQPSNAAAGAAISPAIVVTAKDAGGLTATSYTGNVTLTISTNPGGGTLSGTVTVAAVAGVATFANLSINNAATGYVLTATSGAFTPVVSTAFNIAAGAATQLVFTTQPTSIVAGTPISPAPVVKAKDANGNVVTSFNSNVTIAITTNPGGGTLSGTATVAAVAGVATFNGLSVDKQGAGYGFSATSGALTPASSATFNVTPAAASIIAVQSGNPQSGTAGLPLPSPFVAKITDAFGNAVSGVNVTWSVTAGGGSLAGTTNVSDGVGLVQTTLTLGAVAGTNTVTVTSAGLAGSPLAFTGNSSAGAATKIVFTGQPGNSTAGVALTPSPSVQVQDANNNVVPSYATNITLTLTTNPGGATLGGGTVSPPSSGNAAFAVSLDKVGTGYQLTASSGTLTSAVSNTFNIVAAAASQIVVQSGNGQGGTVNAALAAPFIAKVTDAFGNPVSGVSVTWAVASGGGSLSGTTSTTDAAGLVQTTLTLGSTAGVNTVTVTSGSLTGSPLTFTASSAPGAATKLVFTTQPANVVAGVTFASAPVVQAQDAFNNPVPGYATNIAVAITTNPGGATLGGTTSVSPGGGTSTFIGLSLNKAGVGYVITATSGTLASAASSTFDVTAAAAAAIVVDAGNAQTGAAGTALANPFVARVEDAFGNPVAGTSVTWAVATGGGSLGGTTSTTDAAGKAQTTLTLGTGAGANSVTATSGSLTGSPLTFTATGNPGAATKLVFSTQPTNAVAGVNLSPSPVVQVQDVNNNVVPSYAGSIFVALATNPGSGTLGGTTTLTPTSGQATFSTLTLDKIGVGYTMTATGGVLATATSNAFNITAAAAAAISAETGNNQSVNVPAALAAPIVARVVDAFGNPVAGVSVTWGTPTNGGTLTGTTTTTDANGRVTATWNLVNLGPQTVTATSGSLTGSPVTFSATGTSALANAVWTGAVNTSFNNAGNWSPAQVPISTDAVLIQSGVPTPVLGGQTDLKDLYLQPGATLNANGFTINLTGNLDAGTTITGAGVVNLNGTGTMKGVVVGVVNVNGAYTLAGFDSVSSNLTIGTGGSLAVGANWLGVGGSFATTGTGVLNMSVAGGVLSVAGNVSWGGGTSTLTDGIVQFNGTFTQTGTASSHNATGNHNTWFTGGTQAFSFTDQTGASKFGHVLFNAGTQTANTNFFARAVQLGVGIGNLVGIDGTIKAMVIDSIIDPNARWAVPKVAMIGANAFIGNHLGGAAVSFSGGATTTLLASDSLSGDVSVDNSTTLVLNGKTLKAGGTFTTGTGGRVNMTNAADNLHVASHVTFGGGDENGQLTNGLLKIGGSFTQTTSAVTFVAGAGHTTEFVGNAATTVISFTNGDATTGASCGSSCFGNLTINKTGGDVTTTGRIRALGNVIIGSGINSFSAVGDGETARGLSVDGNFTSTGASSVHIGNLRVKGNTIALDVELTQIDTLNYAGGAGQNVLDRSFDLVIVSGTPTVPVDLTGLQSLLVTTGGTFNPNGHKITIQGTFSTSGTGIYAGTNAADSIWANNVSFLGGTSVPSEGKLVVPGNFTTTGAAFQATGNHTTIFTNQNGETPQAIIGSNPVAGQGLRHVLFSYIGNKVISGEITFSGDVTIDASSGIVYGPGTVAIGGAFSDATMTQAPALRATSVSRLPAAQRAKLDRAARSLAFIQAQKALRPANVRANGVRQLRNARASISGVMSSGVTPARNVDANGGWQVDSTEYYGASITAEAMNTNLAIAGQAVLTTSTQFFGNVTVGKAGVAASQLDVNGEIISISGSFATTAGGKLKMVSNDSVTISGDATFGGASTAGLLTSGNLAIHGSLLQTGGAADAFAASGTHQTDIGFVGAACEVCALRVGRSAMLRRGALVARSGGRIKFANTAAPSVIKFDNPGEGAGTSHFFGLYVIGQETELQSNVSVLDEFETGTGTSFHVYSASPSAVLTSHGSDVRNLTFDYVRWTLLDGAPMYWNQSNVTFNSMDPALDQFTVQRSAAAPVGECDCNYFDLDSWVFNTVPNSGVNYINATDTDGATNGNFMLRMQSVPTPAAHGGHIAEAGGPGGGGSGVINGWVATFLWEGDVSNDWDNVSNWNTFKVPDYQDDVTIPSGTTYSPRIFGGASVRSLTINTGASLDLDGGGGSIAVHGDLTGPTAAYAITCSGCEGLNPVYLAGTGTPRLVSGKMQVDLVVGSEGGAVDYRIGGGSSVLIVDELDINNGDLKVNGGSLTVGSGGIEVNNQGRLVMTNGADQVAVNSGYATFLGAGAGALTAGTLTVTNGGIGNSDSGPADSFTPSGSHKVVLAGTASITFFDPVGSFFNDLSVDAGSSTTLYTDVHVIGTFKRNAGASGVTLAGNGGFTRKLQVNGIDVGTDPTTMSSVAVRLENAGTFTKFNTVTFTGFNAYTGSVFDFARAGTVGVSGLDFTGLTGLGVGGIFVENSGAGTLNITGSLPATGVLNTDFKVTGTGAVTWVP